jgi:hypothetical protein
MTITGKRWKTRENSASGAAQNYSARTGKQRDDTSLARYWSTPGKK